MSAFKLDIAPVTTIDLPVYRKQPPESFAIAAPLFHIIQPNAVFVHQNRVDRVDLLQELLLCRIETVSNIYFETKKGRPILNFMEKPQF